jgi:hypothetical protein
MACVLVLWNSSGEGIDFGLASGHESIVSGFLIGVQDLVIAIAVGGKGELDA